MSFLKINLRIVGIVLVFGICVLVTLPVFAQTTGAGGGKITVTSPLGTKGIEDTAKAITSALVTLAIPIVGIMIIYGAFQIMTAGGDPKKFADGRNTILYAVVGLAIVLLADVIVDVIKETVNPPAS